MLESIVKVVGIWEQGWNTPWAEHDQWIYPIQEFGVSGWYMSPVTGIKKSSFLTEVDNIQSVIEQNPDLTIVWVDEKSATPLSEFTHPEKALYIAGRTSESILPLKKEGDLSVYVESIQNGGGFWAHQAVSIILYDRFIKNR
jgi:hypothetical protein